MKILFLAAYSDLVAASRIKVYQFLPFLAEKGIKYKVISFAPSFLYQLRLRAAGQKRLALIYYLIIYIIRTFKSFWAILIAPKFDIIFIQEPIIPLGLEKILKAQNKNIVFQFTDAVFLPKKEGKGFLEKMIFSAQSNCLKNMAAIAKCCLVETDYNKAAVSKYCPQVEKLTGPIDTKRYSLRQERKEGKKFIIGWVGTPFTTKYLYEIEDALKEIAKKYNIVLRLVGARDDFKIKGANCELKKWTLKDEINWLRTFQVGIMPLTDDKWSRGKAGYKLLQYMSMGIPPVVSAVGFNKEIIRDGVNGFLAETSDEWLRKLSLLIENKDLRKEMGERARLTIEKDYSLNKATGKLIKILEKI